MIGNIQQTALIFGVLGYILIDGKIFLWWRAETQAVWRVVFNLSVTALLVTTLIRIWSTSI